MAWTTPGTAVAGDVLTASFWNSNVRDNLNALAGVPFTRNLIDNGAMTVCQRATSTSFGTGGGAAYYAADRFHVRNYTWSAGSNITISQDSSVYPTGFRNSLKVATGATGLTFASGGSLGVSHKVEGYNIAYAYSSTLTLSFWVRSSVTGTYSISFTNTDVEVATPGRAYVAAYTINVANTWEQKTLTIDMASATASGTWDTTNGVGLDIIWGLGSNADRRTDTYNSGWTNWSGSSIGWQRTTQTQWATNANATFYLTGVQLEVGSVSTPFEYMPFGTELARCQRHFYRANAPVQYAVIGAGYVYASNGASFYVQHPTMMRTAPSGSTVSQSNLSVGYSNTATAVSSIAGIYAGTLASLVVVGTSSVLTLGHGVVLYAGSGGGYLDVGAEL